MKASEMLGKKMLLDGNTAVALAGFAARVQASPNYCITPSTGAVEKLIEFLGESGSQTRWMYNEHAAMEACVGAALLGLRVMTATSSHGLTLMSESMHSAAKERASVVLAVANRSLGLPWNIWPDFQDSLSQRDTGWIQLYCEDVQEVFDTVLQAFKITETVKIPAMVCYEGFILSHLSEIIDIPSQEAIDGFLPPVNTLLPLNPDDPYVFSGSSRTPVHSQRLFEAMRSAPKIIKQVMVAFNKSFGRNYRLVMPYKIQPKQELILVAAGITASIAKEAVDLYGDRVGLLKLRLFRPFPSTALRYWLSKGKKIAVFDRSMSYGAKGIFAQEIESAMYNSNIPIFNYIRGMGGKDIRPEHIVEDIEDALKSDNPRMIRWRS
ncbi:MAG: pyruvate ferredoxin oxidoreductase [Candidatus Nealsonbacteria bacterium]|nr:pyruvate ferredoxin oxidoreductase [Candidatus Nealsonbacteria bacterium]